ncbi:hypothetical protein B566_EDAN005892 [Ephemera danica]|nr:hypothetical protein B566_EDAN005892 [Ephemera danica]
MEPSNVANCVSKGKSELFDCRNHVRVIQPMGDGGRIYVCGTNAHSPKDWVIYSNLTHLPRNEYVPGVGLGIAKCPYDPSDNSTAVWVERGNPGELPGLYSGTNAEFTKADTVIFRTDLHNLTTGRREYSFKRTLKYDSKWLDIIYKVRRERAQEMLGAMAKSLEIAITFASSSSQHSEPSLCHK